MPAQEPESQGRVRRSTVEAEPADEYAGLCRSPGDEGARVLARAREYLRGGKPVPAKLSAAGECTTCLLAAGTKAVPAIEERPRPADKSL